MTCTAQQLQSMDLKYKAPIMQYTEIVPQSWWQKILKLEPRKRLRIKRSFPDSVNCRCEMRVIIK